MTNKKNNPINNINTNETEVVVACVTKLYKLFMQKGRFAGSIPSERRPSKFVEIIRQDCVVLNPPR